MELPPVASEWLDPGDSEEAAALPDDLNLLPSAVAAADDDDDKAAAPKPPAGSWSGEHDTAVVHQSPPCPRPMLPVVAAAGGWIISW